MAYHAMLLNNNLQAMRALLSAEDEEMLREIGSPRVVAVPPEDAWRSLCVMADGEIRSYGVDGKKEPDDAGRRVYLASRDCGLSWKRHRVSDAALGACVRSPYSGRYMTAVVAHEGATRPWDGVSRTGIWAVISENGADDEALTWRKITDMDLDNLRQPMPLRHRKRWLLNAQGRGADGATRPVILRSDDDGETWAASALEAAPPHVPAPPHQGVRWQNGACEATIAELSNGELMLLARTSQDFHYLYRSFDGGETWTKPAPSRFHGTLTMPTLKTLSDGRLMLFWCNTQPLPELSHEGLTPPLNRYEIEGMSEDVFTNRDANHAAISEDDGKTWRGFREMHLNDLRNASDFRSHGGPGDSRDKSVHQFEALELPFGKVLVQFGQHSATRRLAILDPNWLYEKGRKEDFRFGLGNLSTHAYVKSVMGNYRGFTGHCSWNRTDGPLLVPSPDGDFREALRIANSRDERLFSPRQGAVWNFPAAEAGEVEVEMRVEGEGLRLSLTDRWINPVDWTIADCAHVSFAVTRDMLPAGAWTKALVRWNAREASLLIGGRAVSTLPLREGAPNGISYLHLQSLAEAGDEAGALVRSLEMRA